MPKLRLYAMVDAIKTEMGRRGWSQLKLAIEAGLDQGKVSSILAGNHCGEIIAKRIARAFGDKSKPLNEHDTSKYFSTDRRLFMTPALERMVMDVLASFIFVVNPISKTTEPLWAVVSVRPSKLVEFRQKCVDGTIFRDVDYFQSNIGKVLGAGYGEVPAEHDLLQIKNQLGLDEDVFALMQQLSFLDTNKVEDFEKTIKEKIIGMLDVPTGYNPVVVGPSDTK